MKTKDVEFLHKLNNLLLEYDARIYWDYSDSSDLHGVTGQAIGISIGREEILSISGQNLSAYDLTSELE